MMVSPQESSREKGIMSQLKLHLGAARRHLRGFINIDREPSEGVDLVSDVGDLSDFQDESVQEIYSSHTLEYFDRDEVIPVLAEWRRVLSPGGRLYLSVPDFSRLIQIYEKSGEIRYVLGPLFGKWNNPTKSETLYHKTVWDFSSLKNRLEDSGFENVSTFDPSGYLGLIDENFDDYSLAFYPHMDRNGIPVSLSMTAAKPRAE